VIAVLSGACAARGGVPRPRPFPGAALPPSAEEPKRPDTETSPKRVEVPPDTSDSPGSPAAAAPTVPDIARTFIGAVISTALQFQGVPYRNGGSDPSGFDCSGFMQYVFAQHGTVLPREVREQFYVGHEIELKDVKPGDLLFFETVSRGASHVGMVIDGNQFVHAPSSRGVVRVERFTASYWAMRFVGARRLTDPPTTSVAGGGLPGAVRSSK
jgi:cell wall-associated NlpC family hydrolase